MIKFTGFRRVCPIHLQGLWRTSSSSGCCLVRFPECSVADGLRPSDPKNYSKAGVDECLDLLLCRSRGSTCFGYIQQDRFYCCVKDPDFDVDGQVRPRCSLFGVRLLWLCQFLLLHWHQSPPCVSTMLFREVKLVRPSNPSPSCVMGVVLTTALFLRTLLLPLWIFRPRWAE